LSWLTQYCVLARVNDLGPEYERLLGWTTFIVDPGFDIAFAQCQHGEMTVVLDKELETLIGRLVTSGRFHTPHEAVGAGLRKLEGETGIPAEFESFPEGSMAKFFTAENNSEERELFKACSMAVEDQ
jgi:Arc/MetJ-type ribon-helix-helix transcriptional regulator